MPWDTFWPIIVALAGAGLLVLIAELIYRTIRKIVRHLGRRAERRLAQAREHSATGNGAQPGAAGGAKSKPPKGWEAAFYRHAEQLVERLYRPFQMLAALAGAQTVADLIDNETLDPLKGAYGTGSLWPPSGSAWWRACG